MSVPTGVAGSSGSAKRPLRFIEEDVISSCSEYLTDGEMEGYSGDEEWQKSRDEKRRERRERSKKLRAEEKKMRGNEEECARPSTTANAGQQQATQRTPVIYLYDTDFIAAVKRLKALCKSRCTLSFRADHLMIKTTAITDWQAVAAYLAKEKMQYYTYSLKNARPAKVILKYLPPSTDIKTIAAELKGLGIEVKKIVNLKKRDRQASSVFMITAEKTVLQKLYQVTEVCGMSVTVTPFKPRKGPVQCHRCQRFGHSSECCSLGFRCSRCRGEHRVTECDLRDGADFCCANCGGEHPATYRGCVVYQRMKNPKEQRPGITAPRSYPAPKKTEKTFPRLAKSDAVDAELMSSQSAKKWAEIRNAPKPSISTAKSVAAPTVDKKKKVPSADKTEEKKIPKMKEEKKPAPAKMEKKYPVPVTVSADTDSDDESPISAEEMVTSFRFLQQAARKAAVGIRKLNRIDNHLEKLAFLMELAESIFAQ